MILSKEKQPVNQRSYRLLSFYLLPQLLLLATELTSNTLELRPVGRWGRTSRGNARNLASPNPPPPCPPPPFLCAK